MFKFSQLSEQQQALLLAGGGLGLLLLYWMDIIQKSVDLIVIVAALAMLVFGLIKMQAFSKLTSWFNSLRKK